MKRASHGGPGSDMAKKRTTKWSVAQRLAFAADRLFWEGSLQREDLIARFGLSPAQATADIARLRDRLGSGIAYDISRRAYVPSEALSDAPSDAAGILAELRLMAEGIIDRSAGILSEPPTVEMVAALARAVDREVLRHVIWAIRDHQDDRSHLCFVPTTGGDAPPALAARPCLRWFPLACTLP